MSECRLCAVPDSLRLDAASARWNKRALTWAITGAVKGLSEDELVRVYAAAWRWWSDVCGLSFAYTEDARRADILMGSGVIDRRGKVLAWSELPNGSDRPLKQLYEWDENWSAALAAADLAGDYTPLVVTACHEGGHAIGLGHSRDPQALMYPTLNVKAWKPQQDDVKEAQLRYGGPRQPEPLPIPTTPAEAFVLKLWPELKQFQLEEIPGWTRQPPNPRVAEGRGVASVIREDLADK